VLSQDVAHVFGLIQRNGAGKYAPSYVHTHDLGAVTQVLDFEHGAESCLERRQPSSIIACGMDAIHVECNHGEHCPDAEDIDARV
jgi:hypothetical protein